MHKIRIRATEEVVYEKETEVDQETLDYFKEAVLSGRRIDSGEFNLDYSDIVDGEVESDGVEIDVFENGKWKTVFE